MSHSVRNEHPDQVLFGISGSGDLQDVHASASRELECCKVRAYSEWANVAVEVPGVSLDSDPPARRDLRRIGSVAGWEPRPRTWRSRGAKLLCRCDDGGVMSPSVEGGHESEVKIRGRGAGGDE